MVHALPELREQGAVGGDIRGSNADYTTRCFQCHAIEYMRCGRGEHTACGWVCLWCIRLMDGEYK